MFRRVLFLALCTVLFFHASLFASTIAVIHGTGALPASEQRFAKTLATHIVRWYKACGIATDLTDDTALPTTLSGKKLAILVSCAQVNANQLNALNLFTQRGGRLVVFYSASPQLAAFMGVTLKGYQRAPREGEWAQMAFTASRSEGMPRNIEQSSPNLYRATPASGSSTRVLAWWHTRRGTQTTEPAWLRSAKGFWMTHIFTADGDEDAKKQFLVAVAAEQEPSLWQTAARALYATATAPLHNGQLQARLNTIPVGARRSALAAEYQTLQQLNVRVRDLIAKQGNYTIFTYVQELGRRINLFLGATCLARDDEICGVWDHSGQGLYPGDWPRTMKLLADNGITDLYINVAGAGFAHYPSQVLPVSRVATTLGDQVASALAAARPYGIRVHAWLLSFSLEGASSETINAFKKRGWTLQDEKGTELNWLDPANTQVRAYLVRAVMELTQRYPALTGIHLDFIRYPSFQAALGPRTRIAFKQTAANWPACVLAGGAARKAFLAWRAERVTDLVEAVRRTMRKNGSRQQLTTAVYGKYPSCVDSVGQDWLSWLRMGSVDYILPMNYTEDLTTFKTWVAQQTNNPRFARCVLPGIGVTAAESRLNPLQVIEQVEALRRANCPGFVLFDLDIFLRDNILPVLHRGITQKKR